MKHHRESALGEEVFSQTLDSGLQLFLLPKPGFRSLHALLSVGYGSIDRCFSPSASEPAVSVPDGVAHFLEHRLFSSSLGDVGDRFALLGAEVNAHTTFTNTSFFFNCTDRLDDCLELLLGFVRNPVFGAEGVVREREIIARELQAYGDNLEWISFFKVLQAMYGNHPLAVDMAGTPESIQTVDASLLEFCHRTFYRPANMSLIVGGDLEVANVAGAVEGLLAGATRGAAPELHRQAPGQGSGTNTTATLPIAQPRLCVGFRDPHPDLQGEALLRRELALEVLLDILFGSSSDFYLRHYESGLIDAESFGCEIYAEPEFCFCLVGGDTPDPMVLREEIMGELMRARSGDLLERGFSRARRRAYGQSVQRLDQVEGGVGAVHSSVSRGGDPFGLFSVHRELCLEDLQAGLKDVLVPATACQSVILPGGGQE